MKLITRLILGLLVVVFGILIIGEFTSLNNFLLQIVQRQRLGRILEVRISSSFNEITIVEDRNGPLGPVKYQLIFVQATADVDDLESLISDLNLVLWKDVTTRPPSWG